jgi:hypothetical protein
MSRALAGVVVLLLAAAPTAAKPKLERRVDAWLAARAEQDEGAARRLLAPGAVLVSGEGGEPRPISLDSPGWAWDDELGQTITHDALTVEGSTVTGNFSELSDFHRLLGVASWKARITFAFDGNGRIASIVHVPLAPPDNPDLDVLLAPVIEWMRHQRPHDFGELMPRGAIERSRDSARRWRELLIDWRAETGLPPVSLPVRLSAKEQRPKPELPWGMLDPPEMR